MAKAKFIKRTDEEIKHLSPYMKSLFRIIEESIIDLDKTLKKHKKDRVLFKGKTLIDLDRMAEKMKRNRDGLIADQISLLSAKLVS